MNDENSEVRLNAIKAITMLSEAPEGRKALLNHVDMVRFDWIQYIECGRGYSLPYHAYQE